jgi:hypothetical protein
MTEAEWDGREAPRPMLEAVRAGAPGRKPRLSAALYRWLKAR